MNINLHQSDYALDFSRMCFDHESWGHSCQILEDREYVSFKLLIKKDTQWFCHHRLERKLKQMRFMTSQRWLYSFAQLFAAHSTRILDIYCSSLFFSCKKNQHTHSQNKTVTNRKKRWWKNLIQDCMERHGSITHHTFYYFL